jgi:hypothetical protein
MRSATRETLIARARAVPVEREIERRGIRLRGRIERFGPCPRCGGRDRFSINTRKQCFNCRGFGGGGVIDMVMHIDDVDFNEALALLGGEELPRAIRLHQHVDRDDGDAHEREQHRKAAWMWSRRRPITGSIAERYLREARGVTCPLPVTLGFLPPARPEQHSALIAAFATPEEIQPGVLAAPVAVDSVHLTLLRPDGSGKADVKPNKITIGSPGGLPIVLAPPNDLLALGIAEGIEDALSLHEALGIGAWAAGSAPFMPKLAPQISDWIEAFTIELHPDGGRRCALELAEKIRERGTDVFLREAV